LTFEPDQHNSNAGLSGPGGVHGERRQLRQPLGRRRVGRGGVDRQQLIAVVGQEQRLVVERQLSHPRVDVAFQPVAFLSDIVALPPACGVVVVGEQLGAQPAQRLVVGMARGGEAK
jgi:hypothetical protein